MAALTKAAKKLLIHNMVTHACTKKAIPAGIMAENITHNLTVLIMAVAHAHVPELGVERWQELMDNNVVNRRKVGISVIESGVSVVDFGYVSIPTDQSFHWEHQEVLNMLVLAWPKFFHHIDIYQDGGEIALSWGSRLGLLPHIPGTYTIHTPENEEWQASLFNDTGLQLHKSAVKANDMLKTTFFEAWTLRADLEEALKDINTDKQLWEQMPVAQKHYHKPYTGKFKAKPLTDLVKSITARVQDGIPTT